MVQSEPIHKKGICIIPARGGSTRVPKKNIKLLCGKPSIGWVIEVAKASQLFDRIIVSTDSEEIASVSKDWGAEVPFLRTSAFDNLTHANEAIAVALDQAFEYYNETFDYVGMLFANAPLQTSQDLVTAFDLFQQTNRTMICSATEYPLSSPWQSMKLDVTTGEGQFLHPQELKSRTQDREKLYAITGAFCIGKYDEFRKTRRYDVDRIYSPISWQHGLDIDTIEDFELACYVMQKRLDKLSED